MALTKIQSASIAANAITATKIADGAIDIADVADNSISTAKLQTAAVTAPKLGTVYAANITGLGSYATVITLYSANISDIGTIATQAASNVAVTGGNVSGTVNYGSKVKVSDLGTLTTGTTTIDLSTSQVYTAAITASNTVTFAFSNAPAANQSQVVVLRLANAGGGTIAWPANTKFVGGTAPTFTTSGVDMIGIMYDVTTTTYMVFVIGLDVKAP